jgi:hypothetical protein
MGQESGRSLSFPDFKIQIVQHFPDFKIKKVDHFPG